MPYIEAPPEFSAVGCPKRTSRPYDGISHAPHARGTAFRAAVRLNCGNKSGGDDGYSILLMGDNR